MLGCMTLQAFAPGFSLPQGCPERGGSLTLPSALEAFALPTRSHWRSPLTLLWCALDTVSSHISFVQLFMSFNYSRDGWVSSPAHQMNSVYPCIHVLSRCVSMLEIASRLADNLFSHLHMSQE